MTDRELIDASKAAQENAYTPYSNFKVGAALLCRDGSVYSGCNIENATYGATNCAERTAVFKAVSEGNRDFTAIAITSSGGGLTFPCGICRQVLAEFSPEIRILLENENGGICEFKLSELLPHSFSL
ncbi:MAG: cytidine deaminase [Oscillospiraceae bacterium]